MHTGGAEEHAVWEILDTPARLALLLPTLLSAPGASFHATATDLTSVRRLRAAITRCAFAAIGGNGLDSRDIDVINTAAAEFPLVTALDRDGGVRLVDPTARQAIASLARDAVDLFGGPLRNRIRVCAAADCGLLFVDTSRPGKRRWCSMQHCGNLAKVRRYRSLSSTPGPLKDDAPPSKSTRRRTEGDTMRHGGTV